MLALRIQIQVCCVALAAFGQPSQVPETATRDLEAPVTFRSKVSLVLAPVVVRDRKGRAVGTFTKEDFELYDKGKAQRIERFSVEKAGSPHVEFTPGVTNPAAPSSYPIPIAERYTIFLFDDIHFSAADLIRVRAAAEKHLAAAIPATDRVGVYTTSSRTTLELTDDRDKVITAIRSIRGNSLIESGSNRCPPMTYFMADRIINYESDPTNPFLAVATEDAMQCLALDEHARSVAVKAASQAARTMLSLGLANSRNALIGLRTAVRRLSNMPGQRNLLLISPGLYPAELHDEVGALIDSAIRSRILINALDGRGLHSLGTVPDASQRILNGSSVQLKMQAERWNAEAESMFLWEVAEGTGGTVVENSNDLVGGFRKLTEVAEYTYILGFSPQNLKTDGAFHAITVKLKDGTHLTIQARRGYYAPKHLADSVEEARTEMQEALFSREVLQDLPVQVHTQYFKTGDYDAKLGVVAQVDVAKLRFRKAEGRNLDNLTVMAALFDGDGNLQKGVTKLVEMKLKDETLLNKPHSFVTVKTNFDVKIGHYVVRVVVRDSESNLMAAENGSIVIP
jgi:VWFA-related protein